MFDRRAPPIVLNPIFSVKASFCMVLLGVSGELQLEPLLNSYNIIYSLSGQFLNNIIKLEWSVPEISFRVLVL